MKKMAGTSLRVSLRHWSALLLRQGVAVKYDFLKIVERMNILVKEPAVFTTMYIIVPTKTGSSFLINR